MKRRIKAIVDIVMLGLFLYLMSYHAGRGLLLHALLGIATFALFVLHHLLNVQWYKTLAGGKYGFYRALLLVADFLLLAAMLLMMASSLMISGMVFPFTVLPMDFAWVEIHYFATAWGFLLMAFHLGLHLHAPLAKWEKRLKDTPLAYVMWLLEAIVLTAGAYGFTQSGLWPDMMLNPQSSPPMSGFAFYLVYIGIVAAASLLAHWVITIVTVKKEVKR